MYRDCPVRQPESGAEDLSKDVDDYVACSREREELQRYRRNIKEMLAAVKQVTYMSTTRSGILPFS